MNEHFSFWYPNVWTTLGAIFTTLFFPRSGRGRHPRLLSPPWRNPLRWDRRDDQATAALSPLEAMTGDVAALRMALAPPGEPIAEMLRDKLDELMSELQELALAIREVQNEVQGLRREAQVPSA